MKDNNNKKKQFKYIESFIEKSTAKALKKMDKEERLGFVSRNLPDLIDFHKKDGRFQPELLAKVYDRLANEKITKAFVKLSKEEVIKIHTGTDYLVYMLGFMPGFTYLGGMSEKIATPRLESPRLQIYPGSVGIAGKQTGMYPSMSPGGWRIIGRTQLKLYNPDSDTPVYISSGDYVRYVSISEEEYNDILKKVENNEYKLNIRKVKRGELNA